VVSLAALCLALGLYLWLVVFAPSPVPRSIRRQLNFKVLYPSGDAIDANSWKYTSDSQTLGFNAHRKDFTASFTEQRTPLAYQDDAAAYSRFIGSLRPSATFKTRLGEVSITRFIAAGKFEDSGKAAILNTNGTMVVIHPSRELTDNEWRELVDALVVD
jgi:hypothetical protein